MGVPNFMQIQQILGEKGLQGEKWSNQKAQISRDAQPTLLPMKKSRVKWSLRKRNFSNS